MVAEVAKGSKVIRAKSQRVYTWMRLKVFKTEGTACTKIRRWDFVRTPS